MLSRINKILPIFRENLSDCSLIIVASGILCYLCNLHKKKPKVRINMSNEGKYSTVKQ